MIDSIGTSTDLTLQKKSLVQEISSFDKDKISGISQAELKNYITDKDFGETEAPEFAKKLQEKFNELDKDKNGQLSTAEMSTLVNNQGVWQVNPSQALQASADGLVLRGSIQGTSNVSAAATTQNVNSTNLLSHNIQSLVKKGVEYVQKNPQIVDKLTDAVHKII
jgi:Ca2+-binding EF-hand superfamily protein